jgi:long-chain acyl-CoA synthetase
VHLGVERGGSVAFLLRNEVAFFEAWIATTLVGAAPVPINWHSREEEVQHILSDSNAKVVVADADLALKYHSALESRQVLVVGDSAFPVGLRGDRPDGLDWESWATAFAPTDGAPAPTAPTLVYSSGTTGTPKGIRRFPRSPDQAAAYGRIARDVYGIESHMRTVVTTPLYHSAPLFHGMAALMAGGSLVLQPRFDAAELLSMVDRYRVSNLLLVPTMFVRLLELPEATRGAHDLSSLRHVIHGAAPCPPEVKRKMIEWWGPIIHEYYGCTESGIVTAADSVTWLERPGTVGRPVERSTVVILDETGRQQPAAVAGEIFLRNPDAADFTYENLDSERKAIERDGLITCGDIGYLDADGYLFLLDRKKDMVISGGVNIYPAEIEAELLKIGGVADCAVFGIPDPDLGEVLAALVTIAEGSGLDAAEIRKQLEHGLGRLKIPRVIEVRDRLPRDPNGKVLKRELRDPYWSGMDRRV